MSEEHRPSEPQAWDLGPNATMKRLGLAFAALFGAAALFIPTLDGWISAVDRIESIGFGLGSLVTMVAAMLIVEVGLRPLGDGCLEALRTALDPRRPAKRPTSRARLLAGYGSYLALSLAGAALFARDAAQRTEPTLNGMTAIAFGLLFAGGLCVMALAAVTIRAAEGKGDADVASVPAENGRGRGLGFGAAAALGLCLTLWLDAVLTEQTSAPQEETTAGRDD